MYLVHGHGWKFYCFTLRTKIAVEKGLGTTCLFWLLVRGIPVLITNNDIFRAVFPIENVCVQSFAHIKWALKNFVDGQTLSAGSAGFRFSVKSTPIGQKIRLHTAINRADFVSWWMWFNRLTTKVQLHFRTECILLPMYVHNMHQDTKSAGGKKYVYTSQCVNVPLAEFRG